VLVEGVEVDVIEVVGEEVVVVVVLEVVEVIGVDVVVDVGLTPFSFSSHQYVPKAAIGATTSNVAIKRLREIFPLL